MEESSIKNISMKRIARKNSLFRVRKTVSISVSRKSLGNCPLTNRKAAVTYVWSKN